MKTIPSFTIDHIRLLRGIYVSRKDEMGSETVTTFDIRMKEPNREPALGQRKSKKRCYAQPVGRRSRAAENQGTLESAPLE